MTLSRATFRRWLPAILILGLCGWVMWSQHAEIVALRGRAARVDAADDQIAGLRRALAGARRPLPAAAAAAPVTAAANGAAKGPTTPAATNAPTKRNPEFDRLLARQSRLNMLGRFGDIFAGLKLSPEKQAKLEELMLTKMQSAQDARNAASQVGIQYGTSDWYAAVKAAELPDDLDIKALLGDEDYQNYQNLDDQHWVAVWRNQIAMSGVGGSLTEAGVPLSPDQANSMALIYRQLEGNISMMGVSALSTSVDPVSGLSAGQQAIMDQAARVLSPDQSNALRSYFSTVTNPLFVLQNKQ